jgi:hypothetical protein
MGSERLCPAAWEHSTAPHVHMKRVLTPGNKLTPRLGGPLSAQKQPPRQDQPSQAGWHEGRSASLVLLDYACMRELSVPLSGCLGVNIASDLT